MQISKNPQLIKIILLIVFIFGVLFLGFKFNTLASSASATTTSLNNSIASKSSSVSTSIPLALKTYTIAQLSTHNSETDCWTSFDSSYC